MIVLDASVLIAYLDDTDAHHATAETLLAAAVDDEIALNPLSLAEVLVGPVRNGRLQEISAVLRDLEVTELPFPADTARRLAQLRVETGLRMPDCCVLLAAEAVGAELASFDEQLVRAAETRRVPVRRP